MPEKVKEKKNRTEYFNERNKKVSIQMLFRFQKATDMDVVNKIKTQPNKVDYIRRLVRADIEREKQANTNPKQK